MADHNIARLQRFLNVARERMPPGSTDVLVIDGRATEFILVGWSGPDALLLSSDADMRWSENLVRILLSE